MHSLKEKRDNLTGLRTYDTFLSIVAECLEKKDRTPVGVLYMEFDDLARFNHAFGFDIDDQLLKVLSKSIGAVLDKDVLFGRVGTYSFAIALTHADKQHLERLAREIIQLLQEPFSIADNMFYVTVTIGMCTSEDIPQNDAYTLLKYAENTMRDLQKEGTNNYIGFPRKTDNSALKRELQLMHDLPIAIDNNEFYYVYQPQYSHTSGTFTGAEILTRWRHPHLGEIPADVFIPLAEKSGMITPLTMQLLIEASKMFTRLEANGRAEFSLAVNISAKVLAEKSFLENIRLLWELYDFEGRNLTLEVMEDTLPKNMSSFVTLLHNLKEMGITLAIDDFGTGHTSLKYLIDLPIDYIKVDRSLVRNIHADHRTYLLFKAVIGMASALELKVIAEGVETEEEDKLLRNFKYLTIQGYFYAKPLEKEELLQRIQL